jgi:hypothetical protein
VVVVVVADLLGLSAQYVEAALSFIANAKKTQTPYFLYYASHHVHSPQFAGAGATGSTTRGRFGDSLAELDEMVRSSRCIIPPLPPSIACAVWDGRELILCCGCATSPTQPP